MASDSLYRVVTEAIDDFLEHGYDSPRRVEEWLEKIELAIGRSMVPLETLDADLRKRLLAVFERTVRTDRLVRLHPGINRFTLEQVKPKLRAELDKRIISSVDLIKLHRAEARAQALRRFSGWATSIPAGGTDVANRTKVRRDVRRGIAGLNFETRRVVIDQGHKLAAAINELVAADGGAIAARWVSHWREPGYQYREAHKKLDGKVFVVRGNWALKAGLMKSAGHPYTDSVEQPSRPPFCRCYWSFFSYTLRDLPEEMLTAKGRENLREARERIAGLVTV